jgi:hypothetical protein
MVAICGAAGGLVNALLTGNLRPPRRGSPGWIGDVTIGAIAAFVLWSLFDPSSAAAVISEASVHANGTLSIANVVAPSWWESAARVPSRSAGFARNPKAECRRLACNRRASSPGGVSGIKRRTR